MNRMMAKGKRQRADPWTLGAFERPQANHPTPALSPFGLRGENGERPDLPASPSRLSVTALPFFHMTLLHRPLAYLAIALPLALAASGHAATTELKDLSINGGLEDGKARLVIEAQLKGLTGADRERLLFATALQHLIHVGRDNLRHTIHATFDILQGEP